MQYTGTFIKMLPSGRGFKAYIWGQTDMHIMDWNGCNYRRYSIDGQPLFGFKTVEDAIRFVKAKFPTEEDVRKYASRVGDGSFLQDEQIVGSTDVRWKK